MSQKANRGCSKNIRFGDSAGLVGQAFSQRPGNFLERLLARDKISTYLPLSRIGRQPSFVALSSSALPSDWIRKKLTADVVYHDIYCN